MKNKSFLFLFICTIIPLTLACQETKFFHTSKFDSDFFISFNGKYSWIDGKFSSFPGFDLNWLINHRLHLGLNYEVLSSPVSLSDKIGFPEEAEILLQFHQVGLSAGYFAFSNEIISIDPVLQINYGKAAYEPLIDSMVAQNLFLLSPAINIQFNVSQYFRLGLGAGYRITLRSENFVLSNRSLSASFFQIVLRFGTF